MQIHFNLPKAWQKLVSEPDEMLVVLLNETLEKICGFKAENIQITNFLQYIFPQFSIGKLISTSNSIVEPNLVSQLDPQSEVSVDQGTIYLNPDEPDDLFHTKVLAAKFADKISPNNWRSILDTGLQLAFHKGLSAENLQDALNINIKEGIYNLHGYSQIKDVNYSWQSLDANKTAINIIKLARLLKCEIYISFQWREKGRFPMKQGVIHWKP